MKVSGIKKITYIALSSIMLLLLVPVSAKAEVTYYDDNSYTFGVNCPSCGNEFRFDQIGGPFDTHGRLNYINYFDFDKELFVCDLRCENCGQLQNVELCDYPTMSEILEYVTDAGGTIKLGQNHSHHPNCKIYKLTFREEYNTFNLTVWDTSFGGYSVGENLDTIGTPHLLSCFNTDPDPVDPEPDPVPEPQPIIVYDGMETISENSLRFYEDTGQRLYNIERGVNAISSNMIPVISGINSIRDDQIDIKQYMQSVSENTAELVRLQTNDINNEDMLNQLSGNIYKLNTRLTELSTYLGYFFAFMIFIMIVIIFKGCWKLIDKYLLNVTLR